MIVTDTTRLVRADEARLALFHNLTPTPSRTWFYKQVREGVIPSEDIGGFLVFNLDTCRKALGIETT